MIEIDRFLNKISLDMNNTDIIKLLDKITNSVIKLDMENINVPFGLEDESYFYKNKKVNNLLLKLDLKEEDRDFFLNLEDKFKDIFDGLDNKNYTIQSQIFKKKNYVDKLLTKVKFNRNQIISNAYTLDNNFISVYELPQGCVININISPTIYKNQDKLILKWTINTIRCIA